ncbi:OSCP/delta subunit of ATPase [Catenaria anguillulae PL171]|uniref:ATP synthase subunit 5, mitochondrial n=1 Tax=Catenaria anguillulae PL171 TaxID=765915 RepID=A0A1Y2HLJ8_9FUNG|nr:OSCP/delta subunit of ATPase [Catenaria anguillulae PL171]
MNSLRTGLPKLARGFASAAVQAPIQMHSLEGRYATALFTAASKAKSLTAVETDLRAFNASLHADAEFRAFIESPVVDTKYKTQAVKAVAAKKNFNATTTNFFTLLAENGRLDMSVAVLESFGQLMSAHRGEIPVVVTSSQPLDTKTLNRVRDALAKGGKFTAKNQTLIVSNKVNPSILGGMIVEVGDQTIDMSVSSKMAKIEKALAESV